MLLLTKISNIGDICYVASNEETDAADWEAGNTCFTMAKLITWKEYQGYR